MTGATYRGYDTAYGWDYNYLDIHAIEGGKLDLSGLETITSGATVISANGNNSVVDLSNLTSWNDDQPETSSLSVTNGGTVILDKLTTLQGIDQIIANTGGYIDLSDVTNITSTGTQIISDGTGSIIDLSNLTNFTGLTFTATNGGVIRVRPVSKDDAYQVNEDSTLTIATSQGVLVNDINISGQPLSVETVTSTNHGTLNLASDGSFTYTPNVDYVGTDSFTYRVFGADALVTISTVNFTVNNGNNDPPTNIQLTNSNVNENSPNNTIIGQININDPDPNDTHTLTLVDDGGGRFKLVGNQLQVANGRLLDYETKTNHSITIKATDADNLSLEKTFNITVNDINEAPTAIQLSKTTIDENSPNGTVVGTLNTIDPDVNNTFIYSLIDNADGRFAINDNQLIVADGSKLDYETNPNYQITIQTKDTGGLTYIQSFDINLINQDEPNLTLSNITSISEGWSGQPIEISWTVLNNGTAATIGTWRDRIYLSHDNNPDIFLGELTSPITLEIGENYQRSHVFQLPDGIEGNYQIKVVTDADNILVEESETDNSKLTPVFPLHLSPYADLQVSSVIVPTTAKAGQQTTLNWTVINTGTGATNALAWYDYLYLSTNTTLDNNDIYLGQAQNPTYLAKDEAYSQSLTVNLSTSLNGQYYAIVKTDATNLQSELTYENNNTGISLGVVSVEPPPSPGFLHVKNISISPSTGTIYSGQAVTVSWTIENTGDSTLNSWDHAIAFSPIPVWNGNPNSILAWHQGKYSGGLNPGETHTFQTAFTLPSTQFGQFYLVVVPVPPSGTNYDRDYGLSILNITLPPQPDLQVTQVNTDNIGNSGQPIAVSWTVSNEGFGATGGSSWLEQVYLSTDTQWQSNDTLLGTFTHSGRLDSVTDYTRTESVTLPDNIAGTYYIIVKTDNSNVIFEHADNYDAEGNNLNYDPTPLNVTLVPPPQPPKVDLQVTQIESLSEALSGQYLNLRWTVSNQGEDNLSLSQWSDRVILSTDNSIATTNDNITLGTFNQSQAIAVGNNYQSTATVKLPLAVSGNYNVIVTTDSNNNIIEPNAEENNTASIPLSITLSPQPNLQVTQIQTTAAFSGQNLQINWNVTNIGQGNTRTDETSWLDNLYLSSDNTLDANDLLLAQINHNGSLNGGNSYNGLANVTLPIGINGNYTLFVVTDSKNNVYEQGGEENNQTAIALPITLTSPPDLQVISVDAPAQGNTGQPLTLNWTVKNAGEGITLYYPL
jgi:hypothetical protein